MHCTCRSLLTGAFRSALQRPAIAPPAFLVPTLSGIQSASFTSSAPLQRRKREKGRPDANPWRNTSALRHTGVPKWFRGRDDELPVPVLDPKLRSKVQVDENHGLWQFFNKERTTLTPPLQVIEHGRAWTVPELRRKDWEDLHRLWWVCVKEKNRLATERRERNRLGDMYGESEEKDRITEIRRTMKAIKHTLTERFYAWENARVAAMADPEVNLYAKVEEGELAYLDPKKKRASGSQTERTSGEQMPPLEAQNQYLEAKA